MTVSGLISSLLPVLLTALVSTLAVFLLEYINLLGHIRSIISRTYKSPISIILFLSIIAFLSYIFNIMGLVESHLTEIYRFIFAIVLATYSVSFIAYSIHEGQLKTHDPQPPIGWFGSGQIGFGGRLIGEFIQVMSFFQASKLLAAGIAFGHWGLSLSFTNYLLMNIIAFGLAGGAATSIAVRWMKLNEDWDAVIESFKEELTTDEERIGSDSEV